MSYITTVSGKHFDPIYPDNSLIDLRDIAHALSLICRANGHTKFFYSVAQHSLACAKEAEYRKLSREVIIGCLLHDASEAYLSDVTRPVKENLSFYLVVENRLQDLIWKHFIGRLLSENEKKQIFEIDDCMLSLEFHQIMPCSLNESYRNIRSAITCEYRPPEDVETEFIHFLIEH